MKKIVLLSPKDNVAVAAQDIEKGEECIVIGNESTILVEEDISFGHKVSLRNIPCGEPIMKYGEVIARAKKDIMPGTHVHIHNMIGVIE